MSKGNEHEEPIARAMSELGSVIEKEARAMQEANLNLRERPIYEKEQARVIVGNQVEPQSAPHSYIRISDGRLIYEFKFPGVGEVSIHSANQT